MDPVVFFELLSKMEQQCNIPKPDLVFDLDNERREKEEILRENGYAIVYRQEGEILSGSNTFPGMYIGRGQFIAIRHDLMDNLSVSALP